MGDDGQVTDDALAEDALAVLAGRECEHDGGLLDPRTGQCEDESHTHCRWFCGEAYCRHELLSWHDESDYDGPDIPLPPAWLGPVDEWPDEWKHAVFGPLPALAALFAEIEDRRLPALNAFEIASTVAEQIPVSVHTESWEQTQNHASGCGTVVYAEDPGQARALLVGELDSLRSRFEQLAIAHAGIDDIRAEEALGVLADRECPRCNVAISGPRPWYCSDCGTAACLTCGEISNAEGCGHLLPTEGRPGWDRRSCVACGEALQGWKCTKCLSVHCPFCGVRSCAWRGDWTLGTTTCPHLIASWCDASSNWQYPPVLGHGVEFERLSEISLVGRDADAVEAAFGDLTDLAVLLEEDRRGHSVAPILDALIAEAGLRDVVDVRWDDQNGMGSDTGTDYFAADPDTTRAALAALLDRLLACQGRLDAVGEVLTHDRAER